MVMPRYANMTDDPSYQALVEELAKQCDCLPPHLRPCDGLLAGGPCDELDLREPEDPDEDDTEPDDHAPAPFPALNTR